MARLKTIVIEMEWTPNSEYGFYVFDVTSGKKEGITGIASPNMKLALTETLKDIKYYLLEGK